MCTVYYIYAIIIYLDYYYQSCASWCQNQLGSLSSPWPLSRDPSPRMGGAEPAVCHVHSASRRCATAGGRWRHKDIQLEVVDARSARFRVVQESGLNKRKLSCVPNPPSSSKIKVNTCTYSKFPWFGVQFVSSILQFRTSSVFSQCTNAHPLRGK